MNFPYFIVISGPPATGKTTLGTELKRHYNVPFIYKDLIKESLFDTLGIKDSDWSRQLGIASTTILYKIMEELLSGKQSFIMESAFLGNQEPDNILRIIDKYNARPIEIHCTGSKEVIMKRFEEREKSTLRHRGHHRQNGLKDLKKRLENKSYVKLSLTEHTIELNTDDLTTISIVDLIETISRFMKN